MLPYRAFKSKSTASERVSKCRSARFHGSLLLQQAFVLQSLGRSQRQSESAFERWVLFTSKQTHIKQAATLNVQMAQQRRAILHSAHTSLQAQKASLRSIADVAEDWNRCHSSLAQALTDTAVQLPISAVICDDKQVVAALRRSQQLLARFSHVFGSSAQKVRHFIPLHSLVHSLNHSTFRCRYRQ